MHSLEHKNFSKKYLFYMSAVLAQLVLVSQTCADRREYVCRKEDTWKYVLYIWSNLKKNSLFQKNMYTNTKTTLLSLSAT